MDILNAYFMYLLLYGDEEKVLVGEIIKLISGWSILPAFYNPQTTWEKNLNEGLSKSGWGIGKCFDCLNLCRKNQAQS